MKKELLYMLVCVMIAFKYIVYLLCTPCNSVNDNISKYLGPVSLYTSFSIPVITRVFVGTALEMFVNLLYRSRKDFLK